MGIVAAVVVITSRRGDAEGRLGGVVSRRISKALSCLEDEYLRRSKQIDEEVVEAPLVDTLIYI